MTPTYDILYLSYDGLTDDLGRSQIIPYLNGLSDHGHRITVLSADKEGRYAERKEVVKTELNERIHWVSILYHPSPPLISTWYDLQKMSTTCHRLVIERAISIVHVRSYPPMDIALRLKKEYGLPIVFDMRGFYPEERIEGNIWSLKNPIHRWAYRLLKKKERRYLSESDHIVSLTRSARTILHEKHGVSLDRITVIPCCADFDHFSELRTPRDSGPRVVYLGSLGTWYLIPETIALFARIKEYFPNATLRMITSDDHSSISRLVVENGLQLADISVGRVDRELLPKELSKADMSIFLIRESYSKAASSPTKLAELLACGLPILCNSGVGDLERIAKENPYVQAIPLRDMHDLGIKQIIDELIDCDPERIRSSARGQFSLENGILSYREVYRKTTRSDLGTTDDKDELTESSTHP